MPFAAQWIVLTAAHCINASIFEKKAMTVYAGIVNMKDLNEPSAMPPVRVKEYQMHPNHSHTDYDVGLLLLSSPLKFSSKLF
jgi:secreted trypsin-like serine protease